MRRTSYKNIWNKAWLTQPVSLAPLVTLRIVFGVVMVLSTLRFWYLGWIDDHFVDTQLTFKFYGFYWVELLSPAGMYALHASMLIGALGILLGVWYRWAVALFFLSFTYIELVDLTYYLNHYYFVSLVAFLLLLVPANGDLSVDSWCRPEKKISQVPRWMILIFQWQIAIVYVYAGLAKINADWLLEALPLKIWLPAQAHLPLIGPLLKLEITAYIFSWFGMLYDCTIVFFLVWRPTRWLAYGSVVVFHSLTGLLFQIGVFPLVMIGATLIYFSEAFHERLVCTLRALPLALASGRRNGVSRTRDGSGIATWAFLKSTDSYKSVQPGYERSAVGAPASAFSILPISNYQFGRVPPGRSLPGFAIRSVPPYFVGGTLPFGSARQAPHADNRPPGARASRAIVILLTLYFTFQLVYPWRYVVYPGNVFWTEEGYRFSWRVMLMEKAGTATFYVRDAETGREGAVDNSLFLRPHQEKQMAMQPDLILQYAHFLSAHYAAAGVAQPAVRAEVYVTLNGRPSQLLIDPQVDLIGISDGWAHKEWLQPQQKK